MNISYSEPRDHADQITWYYLTLGQAKWMKLIRMSVATHFQTINNNLIFVKIGAIIDSHSSCHFYELTVWLFPSLL